MDAKPDAPAGAEQSPPAAKRSARDRWLLLALLLLALAIGIGIGAALTTHGGGNRVAVAPAPQCGGESAAAGALASAAPIRAIEAPCAAAESSAEETRPALNEARRPTPTRAVRKQSTPSAASTPRDAGAPAAAPVPDLHEALQLLRAAQQALKAADAPRALALLEQMARRAGDVLVEEREVTRALAYCAASDVDSARRTAAALREAGLAPVYAHRLSKSCVGPAPAPARLLEEMRQRALN